MTRVARLAITAAALGVAGISISGCGNQSSSRTILTTLATAPRPTASPSVSFYPTPVRVAPQPQDYSIDWANPLPGGTAVDPQGLATNPAGNGLAFAPYFPRFSAPVSRAFVSSGAGQRSRQVALLMYNFASDSRLSDPEVILRESPDSRTDADLAAEVAHPPGDPADFSLRTVNGTTVLMIINGQLSRAQFLHGGLLFDITGPGVPADVSTDLASQILTQLSGTH